jgi:hypothetical protein
LETTVWAGAEAERRLRLGEGRAALEANGQALATSPDDFGLRAQRLRIAVRLQDLQLARSAFDAAADVAQAIEDLDQLFQLTAVIFEGWRRTSVWLWLQDRLGWLKAEGEAGGSAAALALRLKLALRDVDGFLARLERTPNKPGRPWMADLHRVGAVLRGEMFPDFTRPKILGIGLSKTGTASLTRALTLLGFHAMHFTNQLTNEVLKLEDAFLFDALVDTPVCAVFETLYHMFPRSKFIYTVREPIGWEASFSAHYRFYHASTGFDGIRNQLATRGASQRGQERAAIYASLFGAHANAVAAWQAYDQRVRSFFAAHDAARLLVIDIAAGEGWARLCPFVDRPVPPVDFPWENRSYAQER